MSVPLRNAAPAVRTPSLRTPERAARPKLQVIRTPQLGRSLTPFVLLSVGILGLALVGALLLNTAMAVSAHRIHNQQVYLNGLEERSAELSAALEKSGSPAALRDSAAALGMVPAKSTVHISIGSQNIIGQSGEG